MRGVIKKKFKIFDDEIVDLKMDIDDVNCELEVCKNYLIEVEKVFSMLKDDIELEMYWKYCVKVIGVVVGVVVVIIVGGGKLIIL